MIDSKTIGGPEKDQKEAEGRGVKDDDKNARRWDPAYNGHHYFVHYLGWNVKWHRWSRKNPVQGFSVHGGAVEDADGGVQQSQAKAEGAEDESVGN